MKISGYLSKERFSMKQVAGLLTIVFTGIAVLVYGAVTIPNTFTSGTPAKASEVNANFQALANAMPAAKTAYLPQATITKDVSAGLGGQELIPLSVTLPAPGNVILSASGTICIINGGVNTDQNVSLGISKTSGLMDGGPTTTYTIGQGLDFDQVGTGSQFGSGSQCDSFSLNGMLSEPSAGPITYYLNGITNSSGSGADHAVGGVTFTALYVPNSL